MLDPQLDSLCHALLKQLRQLDGMERALGLHAAAAGMAAAAGQHPPKTVRRLVGGLREVRNACRCGRSGRWLVGWIAMAAAVCRRAAQPLPPLPLSPTPLDRCARP